MPRAAKPPTSRKAPSERASGGLYLYRSHRIEDLADLLARRLASSAPADPVKPLTVVVGSRGMERWLRLRIAERLGVCSNIRFGFPRHVLAELVDGALGLPAPERGVDPWAPEPLAWALCDALARHEHEPELERVRHYLGGEPAAPLGLRRWELGREVADLLDAYALGRRHWVEAWDEAAPERRVGGAAAPRAVLGAGEVVPGPPSPELEPEARWQAALWRALRASLGAHLPFGLRVELARRALLDAPAPGELDALHVFGVTSLPPALIELLGAVARRAAVHFYLFAPARLSGSQEVHPLLGSLGRLSREMQQTLLQYAPELEEPLPARSAPAPASEAAASMLAQLQRDIREARPRSELRAAVERGERAVAPDDDSIRVHDCHGPIRQVEVLRDVLLDLFERHRELEPRDVCVMTPDIETFAPLVESVLGDGRDAPQPSDGWGRAGGPRIPVEIADRALRGVNAVADALLRLLELAAGRVTSSAVLDLLALHPVRARAGLSEGDLGTVAAWVRDSGIRWGADERDRAAAGQPLDVQNTWLFGLQRMALGVLVEAEGEPFRASGGMALPFAGSSATSGAGASAGVLGGEGALLFGRFAELVRRLLARVLALREPRPMARWLEELRSAIDELTLVGPSCAWLREQVMETLDDVLAESSAYADDVSLAVLQRVLAGRFDVPRHGDRPVTGAVTVCSLRPMRNVPFRVVCLLGLDDGLLPRTVGERGLDLTRRHRLLGDHDARDEDRHLFLEALMAARSHLVVLYRGRNERTGESCPPAVPVAELLDTIDLSFAALQGDRPARVQVLRSHRLQPFSPKAFTIAADGAVDAGSFDARACAVARALGSAPRGSIGPFRDGVPLELALEPELEIEVLIEGLRRPVKLLLRTLGVFEPERDDSLGEREPMRLDTLESWSLCDGLLDAALEALARGGPGAPTIAPALDAAAERARAAGALPLGAAGRRLLAGERDKVEQVALAVASAAAPAGLRSHSIDLRIAVPSATEPTTRIFGTVRTVTERGELMDAEVGDPDRPKRFLRAWVRLLCLQASEPVVGRRALLVGWKGDRVRTQTIAPPSDAAALLADLVRLRREALRLPLPYAEQTSHALAVALHRSVGPETPWSEAPLAALERAAEEADQKWDPEYDPDGRGESRDLALRLGFDGRAPHRASDDELPSPEFVRVAERVWRPLLQAVDRAKQAEPAAGSEGGQAP